MSGRVTKSKAKKTSERDSLVRFLEQNSRPADMPCTYCFKHKPQLVCEMDDTGRTDKCKQCVRRGRTCDGVNVASSCVFFPGVFVVFPANSPVQ